MHWLFYDSIDWDYDIETPLVRALGGSQSALCYLTAALARRGDQVTTLTATTNPRTIAGVHCARRDEMSAAHFSSPRTVTVVLNGSATAAGDLRRIVPRGQALVLWHQMAHDHLAVQPLANPRCRELWDRIVCVSDWQQTMFHQHLGVPFGQMEVLRNACAPPFEQLFRDRAALDAAKSGPLRMAYTSTPFRGLNVLLDAFPEIRRRHPHCQLDVFSSMLVYGQAGRTDPHHGLYARCRATPGIRYRGSIAQAELARELAGVSVLAYPNTFFETSCIAVMEALAAGLRVVTSELAALPETSAGWGALVPVSGSREQFTSDFIAALDGVLHELQSDEERVLDQRYRQVQAMNAACTWDIRAGQWQAAAARWLADSAT